MGQTSSWTCASVSAQTDVMVAALPRQVPNVPSVTPDPEAPEDHPREKEGDACPVDGVGLVGPVSP
jgi:hypothetical protein